MSASVRLRRLIAQLCAAAIVLLGFAAEQHYLSHAVETLHAPAQNSSTHWHAKVCEQCLQFAVFHGATPVVATLLLAACDAVEAPIVVERTVPARPFAAYLSRAPPLNV